MNWQEKRKIDQQNAREQLSRSTGKICKKLGCGKELNYVESLYGEYCFRHATENRKEIADKLLRRGSDKKKP